ncbi:hypothetical protein SAMN02910297_00740 [Methanobrevibacter olleyae]|uniref:Uncharacterized protein n=1 Tax=Methanobrevibacter olleyae TaxID=294671 RepID=A0A1I4H707_METOL|nr:hypothetical protein [Methanobrevibacter olleyae]SFL38102.1 hypothetical protein SAMN02910297_00740 [Methanobrevibacter olleyae]
MDIHKDILKFSEFLDFYKEKYTNTSSEISKPKPIDVDYDEEKLEPLVSSNYIMLDFDAMCDDAKFYPKFPEEEFNQPSTVDALYYRIIDENRIQFFLVEFKTFDFGWSSSSDYNSSLDKVLKKLDMDNLDDITKTGVKRLNKIRKTYGYNIEFSLRLKPYESLFVVLPKIYEEYCDENNILEEERLDLYGFFKSNLSDIRLIIVGKSNDNLPRAYSGKLGNLLEKQYRRLDYVNVLSQHNFRLCFDFEFDNITVNFELKDKNTIKSLNKPNKNYV